MNFKKAQSVVDTIKRQSGNSTYYHEVTPSKVNHKPTLFILVVSVVLIVGVFISLYYLV